MDVKLSMRSAHLSALALLLALGLSSLGQVSMATADEAMASDAGVTSTIFITDDAPNAPPAPPQFTPPKSVEGTVVFVDDQPVANSTQPSRQAAPPASTVTIPAQPMVRGNLKVVANRESQSPLSVVQRVPQQQPTIPLVTQQSPIPQSTITTLPTIQPAAAEVPREQLGDIQVAVHAEPMLRQVEVAQEDDSPELLLINAHKLSHKAETVAEYSQIAQACSEALRRGIVGDKKAFARRLSSWALNRRGQLRSDEGKQELAADDFQAALDLNTRNWRALHNRGVSYAQAGSFAEAFDDFNGVIQLNPKYSKAYANRATLYVQAKDLQAAIKDYELAIKHNDQFATAHVGLGRVCHMLGRWDDAIDHFTTAIQIEPTSPDVVCSRGDLHADMGNYGEALSDYARTIELDHEFAHAYRNGAWLLATCPDERYRDPENAVLGAQQALEYSYGERHIALDTLAAAFASNGQFDEAIATVTQAVDLAPENSKFTYLSRLQLYQERQPFQTEPVGDVEQVTYEASDKE